MCSRTALKGKSASADWQALFDSIGSRGAISDGSSWTVGPDEAVFRAMYLDLGAIREEFRADSEPAAITICADVLNIPHRFEWVLPRTKLVIVARRIQSIGYATLTLDYRENSTTSLTVFAGEVDGRFQAIAVTAPDGPQPAAFIFDAAPATGGVRIHLPGREPVETLLHSMRDLPSHSSAVVEQALRIELAFASLLLDQHPDAAQAIIGWVRSCSDGLPGMIQLTAGLDDLVTRQIGATGTPLFPWRAGSLAAIG